MPLEDQALCTDQSTAKILRVVVISLNMIINGILLGTGQEQVEQRPVRPNFSNATNIER